jgi:predicted Ser/Thr protein kinase
MEFETTYFNMDQDKYDNGEPNEEIELFREDRVIDPLNRYYYENAEEFDPDNIPIEESQVLKSILKDKSWERVHGLYPDLKLNQWRNPASNTETAEVKELTKENMKDMGYNGESAEKVSTKVIERRDELTPSSDDDMEEI